MAQQGIRMSDNVTNIATSLHNIQTKLKPIEKKGKNTSQGYAYAKFEDYMDGIKDILAEEGLSLITTVLPEPKRLEPRPTKYGGFQYGVEVAIVVRLFHKTGEWIEIDCYGEGQDSGDKAIYKAITGARKYALACLLGLATKDDPEDDKDDQAEAKQHQKKDNRPNQSHNQQKPQGSAAPNKSNSQQTAPVNNSSPPAAAAPPPPEMIEKEFSMAIDLINAAEDIEKLKINFAKGWTSLARLAGKLHPKLAELTKSYETRKKNFESTEQVT